MCIDVNNSLLKLHKVADGNGDPQMCDFIEGNFLGEQVEAIKKLSDMVTQLNRVGEGKDRKKKISVHNPNLLNCPLGLGLYLWDQQLYRDGTGAGSRAVGTPHHG